MIHGLTDTVVDPKASQKYNVMYQNGVIHFLEGASHQLRGDGDQRENTLQLVADFLN